MKEENNLDGLPELCAFYLFNQIVIGVEHIHSKNIIHRDIKPDNIGLTSNYEIKIFDFTTAKSLDEADITQASGTANYMSPQYLCGKTKIFKDSWKKLDTFSLGIILFYLVYGREPYVIYKSDKLQDIVKRIESIDWKFQFIKEINPELKDLIKNLITIDDSKRLDLAKIKTSNWYRKCREAIIQIENKFRVKEKKIMYLEHLYLRNLNLNNYQKYLK